MDQISILIVEDDVIIAQDISEYLLLMDYDISGIAYNADDAFTLLSTQSPDLVLLDINLGGGKDGIQVAETIQKEYRLPFVYLTSYASKSILDRAKRTHPAGYIVKPFDEKNLFATIEIALFNQSQQGQPQSWKPSLINKTLKTDFTPKEIEVIQDIFEGKTNRQLSEKHSISLNTVKTHVKHIYEKLGVHSRSEAMATLRKWLSNP